MSVFVEGEITDNSLIEIDQTAMADGPVLDPDTGEPVIATLEETGERYTMRWEGGDCHFTPVGDGKAFVLRGAFLAGDGTEDETDANGNVSLTFSADPTRSAG